jgi:MerR family transcriptional regulator, mercuric resistance operon regulatory protein
MKTIGKLAKALDINVETIRFYEREGLIVQPRKPLNGYRLYDDAIASQLEFIGKAKTLGFTLKEIASLMSMEGNCAQIEALSLQKLALIREKITHLQQLEKVISEMTQSCKTNQNQSFCPIIDALK